MTKKPAKAKASEQTAPIRAIKGMDKDMKCRDFQFEIGKSYEAEGEVVCCENGFHAVTGSPFDVWTYYPVVADDGSLSRYFDVMLEGETKSKNDGDSKIASAKITIDAEISLPEFIKRAVSWVIEATKGADETGVSARIGSSGDYARIGSSGYSAQIGSSGDYARIGSSGYSAQIGSSGNYARIIVEGENSVVASAGIGASASGVVGTWISLAEFVEGKCVGFATGCIGQDGILPNTAYVAKGGKLVAA